MFNWSTDTKRLAKNPRFYDKWELEQMINFGLKNKTLNKKKLITLLPELSIDLKKRAFLEYILYGKKPAY